jgi:hypothetical protein
MRRFWYAMLVVVLIALLWKLQSSFQPGTIVDGFQTTSEVTAPDE